MRYRTFSSQLSFKDLLHQHDAASRRISFLPEFLVRRTCCQTEPAMHARADSRGHFGAERSMFVRFDFVQHESVNEEWLVSNDLGKLARWVHRLLDRRFHCRGNSLSESRSVTRTSDD